ncbi:hypothetical protein DERP_014812, partial [Dermatophagoides pteronyssinus]
LIRCFSLPHFISNSTALGISLSKNLILTGSFPLPFPQSYKLTGPHLVPSGGPSPDATIVSTCPSPYASFSPGLHFYLALRYCCRIVPVPRWYGVAAVAGSGGSRAAPAAIGGGAIRGEDHRVNYGGV